MKAIGNTVTGGHLIEMNETEYREFIHLQNAVEGKGFPYMDDSRFGFEREFDFTKTFDVIRAYYWNKCYINQQQKLLDDIKNQLDKKEGVE